jgi:iron complex transport system ATP-binding protein
MIVTNNLNIGYENKVLVEDISIQIESKTISILLGENGFGKSTFLKTLIGVLPPIKGDFYLNHIQHSNLSPIDLSKLISIVIHQPPTISLTVKEILNFSIPTSSNNSIMTYLEMVQMEEFENQNITQLSDGQRQKIMIARALAQETPIIYLDEPTVFLDRKNKKQVIDLIFQLKSTKTILINTHDSEWIDAAPDHIFEIENKKLNKLK